MGASILDYLSGVYFPGSLQELNFRSSSQKNTQKWIPKILVGAILLDF